MSDDEADDDLGDDDDDDDDDDAGFSRKGMEWGEKRANLSLDVGDGDDDGDDDGDGDGDGHQHVNDLGSDAWLFPGQYEQQQQQQQQQQKLLLRFSCADSLDRTNLASFFVALQFVGEVKMCDILQCALRIMHGANEW